jgi:hypothetical protein
MEELADKVESIVDQRISAVRKIIEDICLGSDIDIPLGERTKNPEGQRAPAYPA